MGIQAELVPCAGGELTMCSQLWGGDAGKAELRGALLVPLLSPCPSGAGPSCCLHSQLPAQSGGILHFPEFRGFFCCSGVAVCAEMSLNPALSKPGWGHCPQTAGFIVARRMGPLVSVILGWH